MTSIAAFERRAVAALATLYAFRMMGLFMVLPVLALYGESYRGATPQLLGLALGAYGLTQALLQIPFGMLSDRWGRKPVIAMGLAIFAVGSLVAAVADSVYGLILGRALQGGGAIASALMALVADVTRDESRTKAMASIGASIGVAFAVALVLGPLLAGLGGLPLLFWSTVGLALIGLWVLLHWVPSPKVAAGTHKEAVAIPGLLRSTFRNPQLARLNWGIFSLHFVLMAVFLVLPLILERQLGIGREVHAWVYLPLLLLSFIAMVPFIIVAEKKHQLKPIFTGAVWLLALMVAAMAFWQQQRWNFLVALFFFLLAFNLLEASLPSLMSKLAPAAAKGTASGLYASCQFLGAFAGGVSGGWLLQHHGIGAVLALCVLLLLSWGLLALTMQTPRLLASVQVRLQDCQLAQAQSQLMALPGVVEVVLIEAEATAYLKVDPTLFRRDSLADWHR